MARPARFNRRPWLTALCCLCVSGAAGAQSPAATPAGPAQTQSAGTTPAAPALAQPGAAPEAATAPEASAAAAVDDFERRPQLASTNLAGYTLERCLALTLRNYPRIHEARARVTYRHEQQVQSWYQPFSEFNVTGGLALAPEVRGTPIYSPNTDVALSSNMGLGWSIGVDGVVPLWTFGKLTGTWDASSALVKVAQQDVEKEKNNIKLDVRRAYYGVQLARDALSLLREAKSRVDKYLGTLEKKVKSGDGDEVTLYKLRISRADLIARQSEALQKEAIALASLKFLTGVQGDLPLPDVPLVRVRRRLSPLVTYLNAARLHRPEINMARAGLLAREAQVRIERARYFPDLGLGLQARWAKAPGITDQTNPFVRDTINVVSYGAALVLRYKLDALPTAARVAQAQAQLEELRATERYALGGVAVEVETAYREAEDAERRLDAYADAAANAKRWLIMVQQGIDVGTNDEEDIVDPAKEWALRRFAMMSATFDYNVAVGKLAQATGWESLAKN
jgi:outer membrane protein TolC